MMKNIKFLSLALAVLMVLAMFAGCGETKTDTVTTAVTTEEETTAEVTTTADTSVEETATETAVETTEKIEATEVVTFSEPVIETVAETTVRVVTTEEVMATEAVMTTEAVTATEATTMEIVAETTAETSVESNDEGDFSLGVINGNTYSNAHLGLAIDFDSTWTFQSAEEMQELLSTAQGYMEGTIYEIAMQLGQINAFAATSTEKGANIDILYQHVLPESYSLLKTMTEEEIIDNMILSQADTLKEAFAGAGYENVTLEKVAVTFLNETRHALKTTVSMQGFNMYVLQIMECMEFGGEAFDIAISFISLGNDITADLAAMCYPIG